MSGRVYWLTGWFIDDLYSRFNTTAFWIRTTNQPVRPLKRKHTLTNTHTVHSHFYNELLSLPPGRTFNLFLLMFLLHITSSPLLFLTCSHSCRRKTSSRDRWRWCGADCFTRDLQIQGLWVIIIISLFFSLIKRTLWDYDCFSLSGLHKCQTLININSLSESDRLIHSLSNAGVCPNKWKLLIRSMWRKFD